MAINAIDQMRRTAIRTDEKKKEAQAAAPGPANTPPKEDSLSLTQRMAAGLKEQSQRIVSLLEQDRQEERPEIWDMVDGASGENGDDEADMLGEQLKVMQRCQKIAARIMRGDKVPPEDERYLMENDPDGYKLALAMRTPKKKPKEWESVLKDEKEKTSESGEQETGEASSCEASGGTSDTGGDSGGAPDSGE